jgi:hypothetical protein
MSAIVATERIAERIMHPINITVNIISPKLNESQAPCVRA